MIEAPKICVNCGSNTDTIPWPGKNGPLCQECWEVYSDEEWWKSVKKADEFMSKNTCWYEDEIYKKTS